MLDSRYVLVGRGRELLDFVLVMGSITSLLGLPPSSEGREDDACRTWPNCDPYDEFRGIEPG